MHYNDCRLQVLPERLRFLEMQCAKAGTVTTCRNNKKMRNPVYSRRQSCAQCKQVVGEQVHSGISDRKYTSERRTF